MDTLEDVQAQIEEIDRQLEIGSMFVPKIDALVAERAALAQMMRELTDNKMKDLIDSKRRPGAR